MIMIPFDVYFATVVCGIFLFIGLFAGMFAWGL